MNSGFMKIVTAVAASMGATFLLLSIINIVTKLLQGVSVLSREFYTWDYAINWFIIPSFFFLVLFLLGLFWRKGKYAESLDAIPKHRKL